MSIQPLHPAVVAQIKSSISIVSLNSAVIELLKNSLDAQSINIDITIDYGRGGCIVEDDGQGIPPSEFLDEGRLGKIYHTSKQASQSCIHGGQGIFIASLSALSLLSIRSRYHLHHSYSMISFHKSEIIDRQTPCSESELKTKFNRGTRVIVRDLFGNMPVRVKQRALVSKNRHESERLLQDLRKQIVAHLLSWPSRVAVTLRENLTDQKLVIRIPQVALNNSLVVNSARNTETPDMLSILSQASFISPDDKTSWIPIRASTAELEIKGAISLDPSPSKQTQFISIGVHPIVCVNGRGILYDDINTLFRNSAFGVDNDDSLRDNKVLKYTDDVDIDKEPKTGCKGVDRWPMFYINIDTSIKSTITYESDIDGILDGKGGNLTSILNLLKVAISEFLVRYHFKPKCLKRSNRDYLELQDGLERKRSSALSKQIMPAEHTEIKAKSSEGFSSQNNQVSQNPITRGKGAAILSTNVNVPSFNGDIKGLNSPLDAWSRSKSGVSRAKPKSSCLEVLSAKTASQSGASSKQKSQKVNKDGSEDSKLDFRPLVSKSGEFTHAPFQDATLRVSSNNSRLLEINDSQNVEISSTHLDDEQVIWVNPITKTRSLVNRRTGLTVLETKKGETSSPRTTGSKRLRRLTIQTRIDKNTMSTAQANRPKSPWVNDIIAAWDNPVFKSVEAEIPRIPTFTDSIDTATALHHNSHELCGTGFSRPSGDGFGGIQGRILKNALRNAEVISQVDKKFILVKLHTSKTMEDTREMEFDPKTTLVMIDQHAADERVRIESLMSKLCSAPLASLGEGASLMSGINTLNLEKPLFFRVSISESRHFERHKSYFAKWGILYDVLDHNQQQLVDGNASYTDSLRIIIRTIPPGISERCKTDPKLLISLMRNSIWSREDSGSTGPTRAPHADDDRDTADALHDWPRRMHDCPQGIIELLNSRACRSAIMFNDVLNKTQCEALVRNLARCHFPFQCAHGRPSMVPVVDLAAGHHTSPFESNLMIDLAIGDGKKESATNFKKWRDGIKGQH